MRGLKPSLTIYSLLASHPSDVAYLPFGTSKVSWLEFIALSVPSQNLILPFQWFSQWASSYSGGTAQDFHLLPFFISMKNLLRYYLICKYFIIPPLKDQFIIVELALKLVFHLNYRTGFNKAIGKRILQNLSEKI